MMLDIFNKRTEYINHYIKLMEVRPNLPENYSKDLRKKSAFQIDWDIPPEKCMFFTVFFNKISIRDLFLTDRTSFLDTQKYV